MTFLLAAWLVLAPYESAPASDTLYVVRRGWHLDVGFDAQTLTADFDPVRGALPGARFVVFGFGDRRYLLAAHRHAPDLLAALWPGPGLILATGLVRPPEDAFGSPQVTRVAVSRATLLAAQEYVLQSFRDMRVVAQGPYDGSVFYASTARYSAAHTCNTWIAEVLEAAGLPLHSRGVVFAGPLWRTVVKLGRLSREASCRRNIQPSIPTVPRPSSYSAAAGCCC